MPIADSLFSGRISLRDAKPGSVHFGRIERAKEVLDGAIRTNVTRDGQKWEFHQNKSGFIVGSPQQALRSIRHSLRYRRYARREAYSTIFRGILKGLSEIEE